MASVNLKVWKQQKSILHGQLVGSSHAILTVGTLTFKHICNSGGEYLIDITDIVRIFGNGATFDVVFYDANGAVLKSDTYTIEVAGNIDPNRQIIPANDSISNMCETYGVTTNGVVFPPSFILSSFLASSIFESFDTAKFGKREDDFDVFVSETSQPYTNQLAAVLNGGETLEILSKGEEDVFYTFPLSWGDNTEDRQTPYASTTGRIVQMRHGSPSGIVVFFNQFCSLGNTYHAEFVTEEFAWSFNIVIKDSIGGDVDLGGIIAPSTRKCTGCKYFVSFDFKIDGEFAHVLNFYATKSYSLPVFSTVVRERDCTRKYACVQWVGRTGTRKRATWEVVNVTDEQKGSQEMLNMQNAFDIRMGLLQGLILRLDNLNNYDYWYYSDIVTSSDVRVALVEDDFDFVTDTLKESARVAVTTKSVKQKDGNGGAFSTLNIDINFKRYDTV